MLEIIILFILTLFMLFISYYMTKKTILSPSVICCLMFTVSIFLLLMYAEEWKVDLSFLTIFYIIWSLVCILCGEFMANKIRLKKTHVGINTELEGYKEKKEKEIKINKWITFGCLIFIILTAILYYKQLVNIVANSEYAQSEYGQKYSFLMQARWAKTLEDASVNIFVQLMLTASEAIACVYAYIIIYNYIMHKKICKNIFVYLIIVAYIIATFMTTGRSRMLNFCIYLIVIALLLFAKKNHWKNNQNGKLFTRILIIFLVALWLFYMAGQLTEKSSNYENFFDNFANYFSSSIYAFNEYVKNPEQFRGDTDFFGIHTFSGLYSFLRKFEPNIPTSIVALEYIMCGKYLTNIYTPIRRYLQDFGFLGLSIIMMFLGFFYTKLLNSNKKKNASGLRMIITGYLFFPLFYICIEERFFMDVIINRTVYTIIFIIIMYEILVKNKFKLKRK